MKNLMKATLSIAAIVALPVLSFSAGKSIYGSDDRLNYYEASAGMQTLADSVVSFWKSYKVTENAATGKMDLTVRTLGDAKNLCPGQKFRDENVGAFCSGSLVGEDIVMTAGHCVKTETDCAATKLVFGFKVGKAGEAGARKIIRVNLVMGELSGVESNCVKFYFDFIAKDTLAAQAELIFQAKPTTLRCRKCGATFSPADHAWDCPECHEKAVDIISGRECYMESIEVE